MDVQSIIEENRKRVAIANAIYDPIAGIGGPLEREKIVLDEIGEFWVPKSFVNNESGYQISRAGSLHNMMDYFGLESEDDAYSYYVNERSDHDFEFFSAYALRIEDKETADINPFVLRKAQQKLLIALESMRMAGVPIRIVLLKARQWGGSTLVQMYMFWIQQRLKKNWHITVCAQVDDAAKNIRMMYEKAATHYPAELGRVSLKPYARSPKNLMCVETGGIIGVGSIENPNQFRSYSNKMIHMSEVGIWQNTPKMNGSLIASSLKNACAKVPLSLIVEESTAKGVGNFFHDEWLAAEKGIYGTGEGKSRYKPVFVPWFEIDMYEESIDNYPEFVRSMTSYDLFLWEKGATLEAINWYREYKGGENKTTMEMNEEFPSTPEEAFISSGSRVFPHEYVLNARKTVIKPIDTFNVESKASKGKKALDDIKLISHVNGNLSVWIPPATEVEIEGLKYKVDNRFALFGDFGGTSAKADYSTLAVMDRFWMLYGGLPEIAAEWRGHLDAMLFAWVCAKVGTLYDNGLLALESNTPDQDKNSEGDHFLTAIDQLAGVYRNLYIRNNHESINQDFVPKYGFHTNRSTKTMIIDRLKEAIRDNRQMEYVERSNECCNEMDYFEVKPNGSMGAQEGKHDDLVIVRAGVTWLSLEYMPPPKLILIGGSNNKKGKKIVSAASF